MITGLLAGWQSSLIGAGILLVIILYLCRRQYAAGKAAERAAALKAAAKEQQRYENNFNAAINGSNNELDERLRKLSGKR
jgi:hypothetical protein